MPFPSLHCFCDSARPLRIQINANCEEFGAEEADGRGI